MKVRTVVKKNSLLYVDDSAAQNERFLTHVEVKSLDAEGLASHILKTLHYHKLNPSTIVSQGYDGASVMSGNCSGVQCGLRKLHLWPYMCTAMPTA